MSVVTNDRQNIDLGWQASLFGSGQPEIDTSFAALRRHWLDETSWIDHAANWLSGADQVCADLVHVLPWRQREVTMWDKLLPEPRLTHWWDGSDGSAEPLPVLGDIRWAVSEHYRKPFDNRFQPLPRRA